MKMIKWWWFSFSGDNGFLGGLFVDGVDFKDAHRNVNQLGLNPGGAIAAGELEGCLGPNDLGLYEPYRLYSVADMDERGGSKKVQ